MEMVWTVWWIIAAIVLIGIDIGEIYALIQGIDGSNGFGWFVLHVLFFVITGVLSLITFIFVDFSTLKLFLYDTLIGISIEMILSYLLMALFSRD